VSYFYNISINGMRRALIHREEPSLEGLDQTHFIQIF